jgi:hypothetical protein
MVGRSFLVTFQMKLRTLGKPGSFHIFFHTLRSPIAVALLPTASRSWSLIKANMYAFLTKKILAFSYYHATQFDLVFTVIPIFRISSTSQGNKYLINVPSSQSLGSHLNSWDTRHSLHVRTEPNAFMFGILGIQLSHQMRVDSPSPILLMAPSISRSSLYSIAH